MTRGPVEALLDGLATKRCDVCGTAKLYDMFHDRYECLCDVRTIAANGYFWAHEVDRKFCAFATMTLWQRLWWIVTGHR